MADRGFEGLRDDLDAEDDVAGSGCSSPLSGSPPLGAAVEEGAGAAVVAGGGGPVVVANVGAASFTMRSKNTV